MKGLFTGGVHPAGKKEMSSGGGEIPLLRPDQVVIPLRQHIGESCEPLVKVGERVKMGQKIGDGQERCVPVHASISGVVEDIRPMPHPGGGEVMAVIIQNDFQDTPAPAITPHPQPGNLKAEELFQIIREAGIVGMGGAAFPTQVKATSSLGKIDTLIINACECEPYITADDALLRTQPERVLRGARLLATALRPGQVVLAIEDNKPRAVEALKEHLSRFPDIQLRVLPTRYPQGAEKQLVRSITGQEIPHGKLPAHVGCGVFNAATAAAVSQAVYEGMPLIRRIVTVAGEGVPSPHNFIVPIGTLFSKLIEAAGGLKKDVQLVISGGPMMGKAQGELEVPVVKGTGSVLCLPRGAQQSHPLCIRCGKCVTACPMYLQPLYLYRYELAGDLDKLRRLNLEDCIECGCCAYICPGSLPLVERFRAGKQAMREGKTS